MPIRALKLYSCNDGSKDNTRPLLEMCCSLNAHLKLLNLSRNFGHQAAVTAGLEHATGDAVIVMDGDLQDPPEVLGQFIEKWQEGYDVAYAVRKKRKEGLAKRAAYSLFYRFLRAISNIDIPLDSGDFGLMARRVVDQLNKLPEKNRFVRGIRAWVGFRQVGLEYERHSRYADEPKYTFRSLLKLAFDGIFSFSYRPLVLAMHLGMLITLAAFIGIVTITALKIFTDNYIPGFAHIAILILFLGGVQLFVIGILGEYVGRIYEEVKNRPNYVVESIIDGGTPP